jgi:methionyl-tRNA formyltransferase
MRIVVHGQQAFGKAVLEALLERGEDVVAVYAPPEGGRPDPLAEAAEAAGLPLVRPASFKDPAVLEEFRAFAPDLQVMAFVTLIVPAEVLAAPTRGTIQYHPSLLPVHRGRSAINWPVIKGETETGLTVFWPDGGIDTGDVLLQRRTPISETDTLGSVYFDRLFPMGVEALVEAVGLVEAGTAPRLPQDESLATYEAPCERENARIDWGKPCRQLYDLVRGCDPAPGAWTTSGGEVLQVFAAESLPARAAAGVGGAMGEVVEAGEAGFSVACADGRLRVTRVKPAGGKKMSAGEWAAASGLVPGARLG